jgi:hypothetical protein
MFGVVAVCYNALLTRTSIFNVVEFVIVMVGLLSGLLVGTDWDDDMGIDAGETVDL